MQERATDPDPNGRRAVMALCAEATAGELRDATEALAPPPARDLRPSETGLVMLRGRMGGDGAAFNLGEATVTRASVALDGADAPGFAYHLGRDRAKARDAAVIDALWQVPDRREAVEATLAPIRDRLLAQGAVRRRRVAATRVNFFTMARGEDS